MYYETSTFWKEPDLISDKRGWLCSYCSQETVTKYVATGHDHTDYEYDTCNCAGAKQHGKLYGDLK